MIAHWSALESLLVLQVVEAQLDAEPTPKLVRFRIRRNPHGDLI